MEEHKKNIELYLSSGGDIKLAKRYSAATLANRAKIAYELSQMKIAENFPKTFQEISNSKIEVPEKTRQSVDTVGHTLKRPEPSKPKFLGLITHYPVDLHPTYNEAFSIWLQLCSLKIQLNEVQPSQNKEAYMIQDKMISTIRKFDNCKKALDYYLEHKEVLPTKSKKDFSKLSELDLDRERRNLESSICKRKQTIQKKENELPEKTAPLYQKRIEALNKKRRELEESILDLEKIRHLLDS